jgi:diguanylate cyclase (GGDEF)-like protein
VTRRATIPLAVALAIVVVAGAVLFAARAEETTANTNFNEARIAANMQIAILDQERGIDGFTSSGRAAELAPYFAGRSDLAADLQLAWRFSSDDPVEHRLVARQRAINGRWRVAAQSEIARARSGSSGTAAQAADLRADALITSFLAANSAYRARLDANRRREEGAAALVPVWLICGLGALFAAAGGLYVRRLRRNRLQRERLADADRERQLAAGAVQAAFGEAMQVSESQYEAHRVLACHLEAAIPGSEAIVLNRNNSADRLESTLPLGDAHPLAEPLRESKPRSCLAVRLSRRFERGGEKTEILSCGVCGRLTTPSTCQPLLVGGEVIGSVLLAHEQQLDERGGILLAESVAQAAPVLANLRNLAVAENRASTDALTGLPNRRSVDDTLKRMLAQASRSQRPLSLMLIDLDHFKLINDTLGHDRGDEVLAAFGALLRSELRASDLAGRTGGEEFVVLLPDTSRDGAAQVAEKMREALHRLRVHGVDRPITASFGVATFPEDAEDAGTLTRTADRALYAAKRRGRDRIEVATPLREPGGMGLLDALNPTADV